MGPLWAIVKLIPKLGGFLMTSKSVLEIIKDNVSDADSMRALELKIERLEAQLAGVDKTLKRLTTALFLVAGVAIAALLLAIIKLA
jgi:hypothetical protein